MSEIKVEIPDSVWEPAGGWERKVAELEAENQRLREAMEQAHDALINGLSTKAIFILAKAGGSDGS